MRPLLLSVISCCTCQVYNSAEISSWNYSVALAVYETWIARFGSWPGEKKRAAVELWRIAKALLRALFFVCWMQTRSKSPDLLTGAKSPDLVTPQTPTTRKRSQKNQTPQTDDDVAAQSLAVSAGAADVPGHTTTDRLAAERMEEIAKKIEAAQQKQKELDEELERDRAALRLLLDQPRGALPESVSSAVVTSAAASALKAADEEKRRRELEAAESIRLQSDTAAAEKARVDRLNSLANFRLPTDDALVPVAPRRRAFSESPERAVTRPQKQIRFAPDTHDSDSDDQDEDLSVVPASPSRQKYLKSTAKLLLYLANSTCSHCPPVIPKLLAAHTLVYSSALAHVNGLLRSFFGTEPPSFHHFLLILRELPQFLPVLFAGRPDLEALATTALTKWHRQFNDQLTRTLRLADNCREYVDAQFANFVTSLEDADPATFDPVAVIKRQGNELAKTLTQSRSKQLLKTMFPAPVQSTPHYQQPGGKGTGGKGSQKGGGGKGRGGKGNQQNSWQPPPGLPGQEWSDHHWMYVRFAKDSRGDNIRNSCFKCGGGSAPGSTNHHRARDCRATDAQVQDWVRNMKPVQ